MSQAAPVASWLSRRIAGGFRRSAGRSTIRGIVPGDDGHGQHARQQQNDGQDRHPLRAGCGGSSWAGPAARPIRTCSTSSRWWRSWRGSGWAATGSPPAVTARRRRSRRWARTRRWRSSWRSMTAITVFIISASYSQIIELFPTRRRGYLVASKLLSPEGGHGGRLGAAGRLRADDHDLGGQRGRRPLQFPAGAMGCSTGWRRRSSCCCC